MPTTEPDILASVVSLGLSFLPLLLLLFFGLILSSFVKIVTVLSILRAGLGVQSIPSALVTGGLALALTFFTMYPTLRNTATAIDDFRHNSAGAMGDQDRVKAVEKAAEEWKRFVVLHTHADERDKFAALATKLNNKQNASSVDATATTTADPVLNESWQVLAPAFIVSELKGAFQTGLTVFLPLLIIDLLVANILVALGLQRIDPHLVAFPLKLLVFVVVGGWSLITGNLVATYGVR